MDGDCTGWYVTAPRPCKNIILLYVHWTASGQKTHTGRHSLLAGLWFCMLHLPVPIVGTYTCMDCCVDDIAIEMSCCKWHVTNYLFDNEVDMRKAQKQSTYILIIPTHPEKPLAISNTWLESFWATLLLSLSSCYPVCTMSYFTLLLPVSMHGFCYVCKSAGVIDCCVYWILSNQSPYIFIHVYDINV